MHLLTTPLIYRLLTFQSSPLRTKVVGAVLLVLFTTVMVTHMVMDEFLLHATSFGLGIYVIASRVLRLIPKRVEDPKTQKTLRTLARLGLGESISRGLVEWMQLWPLILVPACFVIGYIVWLIDEFACRHLTRARNVVGTPFAFILELHGWYV